MQARRVIFLRLPSGIFGNGGQTWLSIDLSASYRLLTELGFSVTDCTIDHIFDLQLKRSDIVIYSASEAPEIREYMKDVLYLLNDRCLILPHYDFIMSYENKGFQEIYRSAHGIGNLGGGYHYDLSGDHFKYPFVLKTIEGAGSSGVFLIKSDADLRRARRKLLSIDLRRKAIMLQRRIKLSAGEYAAYSYRHSAFRRYAVQDFVPDMECDYKVLVFGDRLYTLKRYVREGDFRASGSGKFDFGAVIPERVLDFAESVSQKLVAPQLSLDIADSGTSCHLIEYQALNFGPTTLTRSEGYYKREEGRWVRVVARSDLGEAYAHSLAVFFSRHGIEAES